jgi:hypothetical protein
MTHATAYHRTSIGAGTIHGNGRSNGPGALP